MIFCVWLQFLSNFYVWPYGAFSPLPPHLREKEEFSHPPSFERGRGILPSSHLIWERKKDLKGLAVMASLWLQFFCEISYAPQLFNIHGTFRSLIHRWLHILLCHLQRPLSQLWFVTATLMEFVLSILKYSSSQKSFSLSRPPRTLHLHSSSHLLTLGLFNHDYQAVHFPTFHTPWPFGNEFVFAMFHRYRSIELVAPSFLLTFG